jgi:hypothetical protein
MAPIGSQAEIAHVRLSIVLVHDEPTMGRSHDGEVRDASESAFNWALSRLLNLHRDVASDRAGVVEHVSAHATGRFHVSYRSR